MTDRMTKQAITPDGDLQGADGLVERIRNNSSKLQQSKALPTLLVIIGLLVIIYPVVSTQWNNWQQSRVASEYAKLDKGIPPEVHEQAWEEAHRYNEASARGPILDPWIHRYVLDSQEYREYLNLLNDQEAMGRIIIPSIKVNLPIYHGTEEGNLQRGIGHLFGSDLPVGGIGTHSVLTGHTGLPTATLFDNLKKLKNGDSFFIHVAGHKLKYVVDQTKVVLPEEVNDLRPEQDKDLLTLVTCTPYGVNTHRLLVRGHQVPISAEEEAAIEQSQGLVWQWWMLALLAVFIIGIVGLAMWWRSQLNSTKKLLSNSADCETDATQTVVDEPGDS